MKLLFDENLSPKLVSYLQKEYPNSAHVSQLALESSSDNDVWRYAEANNYTIVSKDIDFRDLALVYGTPPKVIAVALGNCETKDVADLLRDELAEIESFVSAGTDSVLVLNRI